MLTGNGKTNAESAAAAKLHEQYNAGKLHQIYAERDEAFKKRRSAIHRKADQR
jgi:hypothetical protein